MNILQLSISIQVLFLITLLLFWNSHFTLEQNCMFSFSLTKQEHVASYTESYLYATTTLSTLPFTYSNCDFEVTYIPLRKMELDGWELTDTRNLQQTSRDHAYT